jgi:Domain of unknown function (DU1801)
MVSSKETTPAAYLKSLPAERRAVVAAVRAVIKKRLPEGYVETMNWGMLSYEVPLKVYPDTYNKKPLSYVALAAQKNNYAIYIMCVNGEKGQRHVIEDAFKAAGKKLDMGGCCVRFKKLENIPLEFIGDVVASTPMKRLIEMAQEARKR